MNDLDKKIEELVAWVARQVAIERYNLTEDSFGEYPNLQPHWVSNSMPTTIKILSHPDLALIDREKANEFPDMVFFCTECKKMQRNTLCNICDESYKPVIPLAEALKEEK